MVIVLASAVFSCSARSLRSFTLSRFFARDLPCQAFGFSDALVNARRVGHFLVCVLGAG